MQENSCIVNKQNLRKNKKMKRAQKCSRKYYGEKLLRKDVKAPKLRIGKISDLNSVEYQVVSDIDLLGYIEVELSRTELIQLCKDSKLTGRSGNGFEVARKLEMLCEANGILIINAVECDPGLVTDSWLYRNKRTEIEDGARLLKKALGLKDVMLATKEPLQNIDGVKQIKVSDRFPMGYERYLIKQILGVEIAQNELPQAHGMIVMNLQTVIAIAEIVQNKKAGEYKYITVQNTCTTKTKVARVHMGDRVKEIINSCFSLEEMENQYIYAGSGAFHCHHACEDEVVDAVTGYIAIGEMPAYETAGKCKGCGACTRNCPAGVIVHRLVKCVEKNEEIDTGKYKQFNVSACIECGACTYGCRAGKDIRKVVKCVKKSI